MNRSGLWMTCLLAGLGMALAGCIGRSSPSVKTAGGDPAPHPDVLTHTSPEQVGQIALELVARDFDIRSGTPQVVLARSITREDLLALNVAALPKTTIEDPPLMLVIIKGDFGNNHLPSIVGTAPIRRG